MSKMSKATSKEARSALAKAKKRAQEFDQLLQAAGVTHKLRVRKALLEDVQQQLLELAAQITDQEIDGEALLSAFLGVVQHTEMPVEADEEIAAPEAPAEGDELPSLDELEQMMMDEEEDEDEDMVKSSSIVSLKQTQLLDRMLRRLDHSDQASEKLTSTAAALMEQNAKLMRAVSALTERVEAVETKQRLRPRASAANSTKISEAEARSRAAAPADADEFWR